jgi:hypothetical protein
MRSSEGHRDQPLSLPLIAVSAPAHGWVKWESSLLRWLLIEFIPAAGAQAILSSIPTLERFLTAETGGRTRIRAVFRGSALVGFPWPFVTHDGPQQ